MQALQKLLQKHLDVPVVIYQLDDTNEANFMRHKAGQVSCWVADEQVLGLNLSDAAMTDDLWEPVHKVLDTSHLRCLNLSDNALTQLHLGDHFRALQWLNASDNVELRSCIFDPALVALEQVDLSGGQLEQLVLPPAANRLQRLVLRGNRLREVALPAQIGQLEYISLDKNPELANPPVEIAQRGTEAIKDWHNANKKVFKEVKIMIVGDAKAGKTSLLRRLKDNQFNENEPQTDGVIIEPFDFAHLSTFASQKGLHDIKAYLWDFGGQDIMRSTHQFFLTNRSAYIVLLEARLDKDPEEQARKWLQQIQRQGGNSPVLIVVNKIEVNRSFGLSIVKLQQEFPQLKDIISISCKEGKDGENIDQLRQLLEKHLPEVELFKSEIDERWIEIKDDLQTKTAQTPRISEQDFRDICAKRGLEEPEKQEDAIAFLHDLGILLHFAELRTKDFFVLDPYWVTYGVYRIITSPEAAQRKGRVPLSRLGYIVNEELRDKEQYVSSKQRKDHYSSTDTLYLAEIMELFKLCFHTHDKTEILIPELLDYQAPMTMVADFEQTKDALRLVYKYPEGMPPHAFTRFMVERNAEMTQSWRKGMELGCNIDSNRARALVLKEEDQIRITVTGEARETSQYLAVLRHQLETINREQKAKAEIWVPLPGYLHLEVDIEVLLNMESAEEYYTEYRLKPPAKFHIRKDLLDGIAGPLGSNGKEGILEVHHHYHGEGKGVTPSGKAETDKKKMMFLVSSPDPLNKFDFGKELKKVVDAWKGSDHRNDFDEPQIRTSVQADRFLKTVLPKRPAYLHLSMHASKTKGLYFEGADGQIDPIEADELLELFKSFGDEGYAPEVCVLSACNTQIYAEMIQTFCGAVVGTCDFFPDEAACYYAEILYELIFDKVSITTAHKQACNALKRKYGEDLTHFSGQKYPIYQIPVLFTHTTT